MANAFGITGADIVAILQLGLSGLAFLLMLLCFYLLYREQSGPGDVRPEMINSIDRFRRSCLVLAVIIGAFAIIDIAIKRYVAPVAVSEDCTDAVQRVQLLAQGEQHDVGSLRALIRNGLTDCMRGATQGDPAPNQGR